ncbi:VOC family protein [Actinophytocola sp.]|uniref:VOC family protein n=1 Tax=Actinophytocola sp. TaxID=1872138 RepID=UPI002ED41BF3
MTAGRLSLDHVGIVVPSMDEAIDWWTTLFGVRLVWREQPVDVEGARLGLPGEAVRLQGAIFDTGGSAFLELHEYFKPAGASPRRPCDTGYNHLSFYAEDLAHEYGRLQAAGMTFFGEPMLITSGGLVGHQWVWGADPWGTVVELHQHARPHGEAGRLVLDHPGITVEDLDVATRWYCEAYGWTVRWTEGWTEIDGRLFGMDEKVIQLRGRILDTGGTFVELHEFGSPRGTGKRRTCDLGQGHIAVYAHDIVGEYERLSVGGMQFYKDVMRIPDGALKGFDWAYGVTPFGTTVEICRHPPAPVLALG